MNTATEATVLPLCSLRFESADLRSPNRSLRGQRVTRTHDIFIAGNRIQFSRTEGKDFPSERVAVFSLSRLCCQGLSKLFFSPRLLRAFSPAFLRGWKVRSGSRYLVFIVFAVKDFVNFLLRPPASHFPVRRLAAPRRWGPKREAVYAPGRAPSASTFVAICRFPKNAAVSRVSDRKRLYFCTVIGRPDFV